MENFEASRLPLLKPDELSAVQKPLYEKIDNTLVSWATKMGFVAKFADGGLAGPFNAFLYSPEITAKLLPFQEAESALTSLSKSVREVVILTVGAVWNCDYERYAHTAVARNAGLSEASIRSLVAGRDAWELSKEEQVAQRFTRELCRNHQISDGLYAEAEKTLGQKGLVDLIYLAGIYMMVSGLLNTFRVPIPEAL